MLLQLYSTFHKIYWGGVLKLLKLTLGLFFVCISEEFFTHREASSLLVRG